MSTRLQSVLTSQLSQNPALPVSVPVSAPVSLQVANQSSAQADELNNANSAFSQQTLISLEGIAKGIFEQFCLPSFYAVVNFKTSLKLRQNFQPWRPSVLPKTRYKRKWCCEI